MAISVDGNLILDEEFRNPATGAADEHEVASLNFTGDSDGLETLFGTTVGNLGEGAATGFPQYARKLNYISSTGTPNPVTDYGFVQDNSGTAFSTTVGVDSGLTTLDGTSIYLFAYSADNNNILLGRIGNSATGTVAFALVLDEHRTGTTLDSTDMYLIQYQPLQHSGTNLVDSADTLDLLDGSTNKVFLQSTYLDQGQGILVTSQTVAFEGHDLVGFEGGSKEVMHSELADDFFVQFLGDQVTGGKSGVAMKAGNDSTYTPGEVFHASPTSIQVTNSTNGVAGDTIQNGEVLDMLFLSDHPTGAGAVNPVSTATTSADGIFLRFDGIGNREDLVVILKLADPNALGTITTVAVVIDNADIFRKGSSGFPDYVTTSPGAGQLSYLAANPLDNNDGMVFIEANDYQFDGNEGKVIVGAQLLSSTDGITSGSGIDLNRTVGDNGGSENNGTQNFGSATKDSDVIKISDIGFLRDTPTLVPAHEYLGIGANLIVQDDGPVIDETTVGSGEDLLVSNTVNATDGDEYLFDAGADGVGAWTIIGAPSGSGGLTVSYDGDTTEQSILGKLNGTDFYTLTVDNDGNYDFTLLSAMPGTSLPVSSTQVHAAGPASPYDVLLESSTDYMRITGTNSDGSNGLFNASNGYGGIANGNLDADETISISLMDSKDTAATGDDVKVDITGIKIPTKTSGSGGGTFHYNYFAYNDGNLVYSQTNVAVTRNSSIEVNSGGILFDTLVIESIDGIAVKLGVGDSEIFVPPPDIRLNFNLQLADGDGDTDTASFFVDIDGNGGGISNPTSYSYFDIA